MHNHITSIAASALLDHPFLCYTACSVSNCKECDGDIDADTCNDCLTGYVLSDNVCCKLLNHISQQNRNDLL